MEEEADRSGRAPMNAALAQSDATQDVRVDTQVWTAAHEMSAEQKQQPEWLWYSQEWTAPTFGRWPKNASASPAPYIRADIALAQSDAGPTHQDMAYFGASEAAAYYYPGEDQRALRDAYCRGAAAHAPHPDVSGLIEAEDTALRQKWGSEWDDFCISIAEALRSRAADRSGPRPDVSGLIEAADYLIARLQSSLKGKPVRDLDEAVEAYRNARSRAADRSGK